MTKEQREGEYKRVKELGRLQYLKLQTLKEFGTKEEIAEREKPAEPEPKKKGKK